MIDRCVESGASIVCGVRRPEEAMGFTDAHFIHVLRQPSLSNPNDNYDAEGWNLLLPRWNVKQTTVHNTGTLDDLDARAKQIAEGML